MDITIGLIGMGWIGATHIDVLKKIPGAHAVAMTDVFIEKSVG